MVPGVITTACRRYVHIAPGARLRWAVRCNAVRFHRDVAAIHRNRGQFHRERIVFARIGTRRCDFSKCFASSFQQNVSLDRDVLSEFRFETSAYHSLRGERLTVLTVSVVPAGIVAAFTDEAATHAQMTEITAMTFVCFIFLRVCELGFQSGVS